MKNIIIFLFGAYMILGMTSCVDIATIHQDVVNINYSDTTCIIKTEVWICSTDNHVVFDRTRSHANANNIKEIKKRDMAIAKERRSDAYKIISQRRSQNRKRENIQLILD